MLKFDVSNQSIIRKDKFCVVAGSHNYLKAKFNFITDEWNDIETINVIFKRTYGRTYNVPLDENQECIVPCDLIDTEGSFTVSVYGGNLITTDTNKINVKKSGIHIAHN